MNIQRIDVLKVSDPTNGLILGYGLKSKTKNWFAYYYKTEAAAIKVAQNIESRWTNRDDDVNFYYKNPMSYVDR